MKNIYLLIFSALMTVTAFAQKKEWRLVGVERNNEYIVSANKKDLLKEINENFDKEYNKVYIKSGYTVGDKKEKFYYLDIVTSYTGKRLVRWLTYKDGKFYLETTGKNDVSHLDFYASCAGDQKCEPNLIIIGGEYNWVCGDYKDVESDGNGKCTKEVSVVDGTK